jgi:monofunctional biosynthetic peptidoglycan transglycosylase
MGKLWRRLAKGLAAAVLLSIVAVFALRFLPPPITAFMLRYCVLALVDGRKAAELRYDWVDYGGISKDAALAIVAAEDQRFPTHWGFDFKSISRAFEHNRQGRALRGASTITQQLAKNLFLWPGRSYVRKAIEAYFTVLIEALWSKRRILEVYLNVVELGDGVFGIGAASRAYFRKPPAALKREEAALLAAVLPNPIGMSVRRPSRYVRARQAWILKQMRRLGGTSYVARL